MKNNSQADQPVSLTEANVDTLHILAPDSKSAYQLAEIVKAEDWGGMVTVHDAREDVASALGATGTEYAIISIWWD